MTPKLPSRIYQYKSWVVWRLEGVNGRTTKVPYRPDGGPAATNKPDTWTYYGESAEAVPKGKYNGVGFVFSSTHGFYGVDLDHSHNAGHFSTVACEWMVRLRSFSEYSQSGQGVHILGEGEVTQNRKTKEVEIYKTGRYFALTGNWIDETPLKITRNQDQLNLLIGSYFPAVVGSTGESPRRIVTSTIEDDELIKRCKSARNGAKFSRLWEGDITDYPSASEADLSLASLISFHSGDPEQVRRVMRGSGLVRPKWDTRRGDRTYLEATIDKAINGSGPIKSPSKKGTNEKQFFHFIRGK
jgi:putative DNA primase/helicase